MFDFINTKIYGLEIFHLWPLLFFGPFFLFFFYSMALKDIINPTPEIKEIHRHQKEEKQRQKEENKKKMLLQKARNRDSDVKITPLRLLAQALLFVPIAAFIGFFSNSPAYKIMPPNTARIKLSMFLPGDRKEKCRKKTVGENARLPVHLRAKMSCPRERWSVRVELKLDDKRLYAGSVAPFGLAHDGQSSFYQNIKVPSGEHTMFVGVAVRGDADKFDYVMKKEINLDQAQVMVVTFDTTTHKIYTIANQD